MKRLSPVLLLAGAVAVVYLNSFRGVFQFDDYNVIVENGGVHTWRASLAGLPGGIRPLLKFTYTMNWTSGLGPFGFHLVNVILHAANAVLLFHIALRIGAPSVSGFAALLPALLFAVHSVQTEAVTYISGRSVSLMALFYLGSIFVYLRGRERGSRFLLYAVSPALFLLAAVRIEDRNRSAPQHRGPEDHPIPMGRGDLKEHRASIVGTALVALMGVGVLFF